MAGVVVDALQGGLKDTKESEEDKTMDFRRAETSVSSDNWLAGSHRNQL